MDKNTIYYESAEITMARMPDNFIDLIVTSPPYDNLRKYNGFSFLLLMNASIMHG